MACSDTVSRGHKRQSYTTNPNTVTWRYLISSHSKTSAILIAILAFVVGWRFQFLSLDALLGPSPSLHNDTYWESHREEVRTAFTTSWDAYAKYAWGEC